MRMAAPDIVLFVVGLLLFSGASYAIVQQGGLAALGEQSSTLGVFNVAYETARADLETADVASFRTLEQTFDVNATNVATIFVVVDCADTSPTAAQVPFTLQIEIVPPESSNLSATTSTGNCAGGMEFEVPVADVPDAGTVSADTETEARAALPANATSTQAQGAWTVRISGARNGPAGPLPLPQDPATPSGSITLAAEQWTPRLTAVQGR